MSDIAVTVSGTDVAYGIAQLSRNEIIEIIKMIDNCQADWDLTRAIYTWAEQRLMEARELGEIE